MFPRISTLDWKDLFPLSTGSCPFPLYLFFYSSSLYSIFNEHAPLLHVAVLRVGPLSVRAVLTAGGDDGNRTHDPLLAGQVLSQLSYTPIGGIPSVSLSVTEN